MEKGRVYWITGLPGSGKTTVGTALYYRLRETRNNIIILDGDVLKQFVGDTVGYTRDERLARAKKYSNICRILSDQGMWVIICTVALFDDVRDWNRRNIDGYIEIFLDVSLEILRERNKKGLYSDMKENSQLFNGVEFPKNPDIVLGKDENDVHSFVERILEMKPTLESDYDRDRLYWNNMYKKQVLILEPSDFAKTIINDVRQCSGGLLELGCGNGRDSLFFIKNGVRVTAVDASDSAIKILREQTAGSDAIFVCDDFVKCKALYQVTYGSIYSRFTLHAINERQEDELFENIRTALKPNGRLYIETRTTKDDLFGIGENVGRNAYVYNDHYRRFIDAKELKGKLELLGFKIISVAERRGFSKTEESDPVLLRLVASI